MDDDRSLPTATTDGSPSTATASDVHLKSVKEMGEEEEEDGYDYVILGTGLTECILSGLLSMDGHRVLHVDRQDHYGGDCASLNLLQLFERFRSGDPVDALKLRKRYGRERDYNLDVVPKFMLAGGDLIDILVHTDVQRYLQFQQIAGSYVWLRASGLYKVPATEMEALSSGLLGLFQKGKVTAFLHYVKAADPDDPTTWGSGYPLDRLPCRRVFADYGLDSNSQDMLGHALALHSDDSYLDRPAVDTFRRIRLYMNSLARFGKSPYVYPLYGLGELPQAFARLSAIYGGTYVLSCPLHSVRLDDGARVSTVCLDVPSAFSSAPPEATNPNSSGQQRKWIKCRRGVIAHPSYFPERVRQTHRVVRAICLMDHAIPKTNQSDSCQIIIPQRQLNRHSGISFALLTLMDERE